MKQFEAARAFLQRFQVVLSVLFVVLCALWSAQATILTLPDAKGRPFEMKPSSVSLESVRLWNYALNVVPTTKTDDDSVRISQGLAEKKTFLSTFGFWTGSWAGGGLGPPTPFGPYFRPLTSQLWWLQRHFAGPNSLHFFLLVHIIWHLAFTLALWALLRLWWSNAGALLIIWVWSVGLSASVNDYATPFGALLMWKDDPELTVGLCVLAAMAAMRAFVLTSRRKWLVLALLAFVLSLSFKESGYVTPFFVIFTLWWFGATKRQWRVAPLFFVAAGAAFAYRIWALQGMGGYHGSNGSWWSRGINELVGGSISAAVITGAAIPLGLAALLLAIFESLRSHRQRALFWGSICIASGIWSQVNDPTEIGTFIQLADVSFKSPIYYALPTTLLTLILWQLFVLRRPRIMVAGYIWLLLAYIPLLKQAVTSHGFYFFSIGWAIWFAGVIAWVYRQSRHFWHGETGQTALHEAHSRINSLVRRPKAPGPA